MWQIKKLHEIEKIQEACRITDRIFAKMRRILTQKIAASSHSSSSQWWMTEKELESRLLNEIKSAWCRPSFDPIIAAGSNAAHPHWKADDTPLHGFVVIDFGVVYEWYMSDMTRTIFISNSWWAKSSRLKAASITAKEKKLYYRVLAAQLDSMAYIKPGRYYKDAHWVAAATLWSERKYFIHSLGHGIGTIIHEHPRISPKGKWVFKENMCITVEPGVYQEGKLGIRIEDTCLVTEYGCMPLTHSTKKLLCF